MPVAVANLKDVMDEFRLHIAALEHITAAYCTVDVSPPKVHVWTLLDARDDQTEDELARAEYKLSRSFSQVDFDFTTIHLRGRSPEQFIPEGAWPIHIRDRHVLQHFQRALAARADALAR